MVHFPPADFLQTFAIIDRRRNPGRKYRVFIFEIPAVAAKVMVPHPHPPHLLLPPPSGLDFPTLRRHLPLRRWQFRLMYENSAKRLSYANKRANYTAGESKGPPHFSHSCKSNLCQRGCGGTQKGCRHLHRLCFFPPPSCLRG